jgi:phosphopantothenoylcysteine decarboxylase / phosphopantothenate---cysteine ligase
MTSDLSSPRRVLICIGGGIAAYKTCEIISTLFQAGIEVRVILTAGAEQFITPLTVATLSRHPAYGDRDLWQPIHHRPLHIELGEWADLMVIAPLTANTLAKLVYGLADNLLTNTVLASTCPVLVAPAMNTDMWEQVSVRRNWALLEEDRRYHSAGIGMGLLACDRVGAGRMSEPSEIIPQILSLLHTKGDRDLSGKRILISAGGTREYLDPVRFIGNPSTGKMGLALALAAADRGGVVTLVHSSLPIDRLPTRIKSIPVKDSQQMYAQMVAEFPQADITLMTAAVADVKPLEYSEVKLPKSELPDLLKLAPVIDIVAELGKMKTDRQLLIGFAAQTGDIVTPAVAKLARKGLDAIVANPVDIAGSGFGSDFNQAILITKTGNRSEIPHCSKLEMAHHIFDRINSEID